MLNISLKHQTEYKQGTAFSKIFLGKIIPNTIIYKRSIMQKGKQKSKQMC